MLHTDRPLLTKILPRNEGKLKSYYSCCDFRAWSHDCSKRDQYLKQWIKADMPICVLPVCTLTSFLEKMTISNRPTVPPKCHPDCKSKILLENIYKSCDAMKKCLSETKDFNRYLEEEELETSHWPCDKCLDALKTIKLFWKIVVEKIFKINFTKCPCSNEYVRHRDSVRSIANTWRKEIIKQSFYIQCKSKDPTQHHNPLDSYSCDHFYVRKSSSLNQRRCKSEFCYESGSVTALINDNSDIRNMSKSLNENRGIQTDISFTNKIKDNVEKISRYTCTKCETIDKGCEPCKCGRKCAENIDKLQNQLHSERLSNERLRREIKTLRVELQSVYENCTWKMYYDPNKKLSCKVDLVPKCESHVKEDDCPTYKLDSETVITMKKLQNKNYDHVSLLQVLHKTNKPTMDEIMLGDHCTEKQYEPLYLLNGVKKTFESMLKREWAKAANQTIESSSLKKTLSSSSFSHTSYSSDSTLDYLSAQGKSKSYCTES